MLLRVDETFFIISVQQNLAIVDNGVWNTKSIYWATFECSEGASANKDEDLPLRMSIKRQRAMS